MALRLRPSRTTLQERRRLLLLHVLLVAALVLLSSLTATADAVASSKKSPTSVVSCCLCPECQPAATTTSTSSSTDCQDAHAVAQVLDEKDDLCQVLVANHRSDCCLDDDDEDTVQQQQEEEALGRMIRAAIPRPTPVALSVPMPTVVHTPQKQQHRQLGPHPVCWLCYQPNRPPRNTNMGIIVGWLPFLPCLDYYQMGRDGDIPDQLCQLTQAVAYDDCGCHDNAPTLAPNGWTVTTPTGQTTPVGGGGGSPSPPSGGGGSPSPPSGSGGGTSPTSISESCFPGSATVWEETKGTVYMRDVRIGDRVLTSHDGQYSTVYSFYHKQVDSQASYLQIFLDNREEPLEISHNHLVFVGGGGNAVPAGRVKVGDSLGASKNVLVVREIRTVQREGIYAPATFAGDIVVNDVRVSTYSSHVPQSALDEHMAAHWIVTYHRVYCRLFWESCRDETYDMSGLSTMVRPVIKAAYWVGEFQPAVQVSVSVISVPFLLAVYFAEQVLLVRFLTIAMVAVLAVVALFQSPARRQRASTDKLKAS